MAYKITSAVATEPLTLTEAKAFLRVEHSADDTLITDMITSARAQVEAMTGRALAAHTVEEYFDGWPSDGVLKLSLTPVTSITSVAYVADGAPDVTVYTTWSATNYVKDLVSLPCRIVKLDTVDFPDLEYVPNAVKVTYVANALSGNENARILAIAKMAMRFIITHDYERRSDPITRLNQSTIRRTEQLIRQIKAY